MEKWVLMMAVMVTGATMALGSGETFKDGSQLRELCAAAESPEEMQDPSGQLAAVSMTSHCFGYVMGAYDSYIQTVHLESLTSRICLPSPITNYQVTPVVRQFLENNPDLLEFSAAGLVLTALAQEYPCDVEASGAEPEQ